MNKEELATKFAHDTLQLESLIANQDYSHYFRLIRESFLAGFEFGKIATIREADTSTDFNISEDSAKL